MVQLKSPIVETEEDFKRLEGYGFLKNSISAHCCNNPFDGELGSFLNIIVEYQVEPKIVDGYVIKDVSGILLNRELLDLWNSTYPHLGVEDLFSQSKLSR